MTKRIKLSKAAVKALVELFGAELARDLVERVPKKELAPPASEDDLILIEVRVRARYQSGEAWTVGGPVLSDPIYDEVARFFSSQFLLAMEDPPQPPKRRANANPPARFLGKKARR